MCCTMSHLQTCQAALPPADTLQVRWDDPQLLWNLVQLE